MFQFTTTNVINSNLDSNGTTAKFSGTSDYFEVKRVGKFLGANIVGHVHKRSYYAPILEEAKITIPTITAGLVARLDVDVRLSQQTEADYANSFLYFKKPIVIEILASGTAGTDAAKFVSEINKISDRYGYSHITASASGAVITLKAKSPYQRFFNIAILEEDNTNTNSLVTPLFKDVSAATFSISIPGRPGFGDDDWMQRRIMVQTAENVRHFGLSKDERPILGGKYTEYVIRYKVEKDHTDGVSHGVEYSVTTHVFYVLESLIASFETELDKTATITPVYGGGVVQITGNASVAGSGTTTLVAQGGVSPYVWSVVTGTSATVASGGVVTAHASIKGVTVIKATDSKGNSATFSILVT